MRKSSLPQSYGCVHVMLSIFSGNFSLEIHFFTVLWLRNICTVIPHSRVISAICNFRDEVETAIKNVVKEAVVEAVGSSQSVEEDALGEEGKEDRTLASKMRRLSFRDWLSLLDIIFRRLLLLLKYEIWIYHEFYGKILMCCVIFSITPSAARTLLFSRSAQTTDIGTYLQFPHSNRCMNLANNSEWN